jgi:YgiT-type zinc finger domain-containing protein
VGSGLEDAEGGNKVKCMRCGKTAYKSMTSEAIELGFGLLVIRNIPCYKCEECDEIFYTGDVVQKVESIIADAKQLMQDIRVIDFTDAA